MAKGQIIIFEQVLLFTMGVTIFVVCFTLFSLYQANYLTITLDDQLTGVKEYVTSNIVELSRKGEFNSTVVLKIPKTIGNEFYRIRFEGSGTATILNISLIGGKSYKSSELYGLDSHYNFAGDVTSDRGKIVIYKTGNSINIK